VTNDHLIHMQELIESAISSLKTAQAMLRDTTGIADPAHERHMLNANRLGGKVDGKIVEGVFDGQNMVDADGNTYPVPANYASKSKLVEGDGMKLIITDEGKFIYKQIAPLERQTVRGVLIQEDGQYKILAEGKTYRVLLASVTFYRAEVGDQIVILLPKSQEAHWGAVDAVIPRHIAERSAKGIFKQPADEGEDGELTPAVHT